MVTLLVYAVWVENRLYTQTCLYLKRRNTKLWAFRWMDVGWLIRQNVKTLRMHLRVRNYIACVDGEIIEQNMDISTYIPLVPEGARLIGWEGGWINNELMNVGISYQFLGGDTWIGFFTGLLDPFQGIWLDAPLSNLDKSTPVGYSPDMTRELFKSEDGMVLWDMIYRISYGQLQKDLGLVLHI